MEDLNLVAEFSLDSFSPLSTTLTHDSYLDGFSTGEIFQDYFTLSENDVSKTIDPAETITVLEMVEELGVFDLFVYSYVGSNDLVDLSATVSSFSEYMEDRALEVVNSEAADWQSTSVADNSLLTEAVSIAINNLVEFQEEPDFLNELGIAFGEDILADEARNAIESIINGDANASLEIVQINNLETNAAFAPATSTIYLSQDFLEDNETNPNNVANVILEEWGHYLDTVFNDTDSPGDEGNIFLNLVKDFNFDLETLKAEDDTTILDIDGQDIFVEQATGRITLTSRWTIFDSVRGSVLAFRRDPTFRSLTDVYFFNASTGFERFYDNRSTISFFDGQFQAFVGTNLRTDPFSGRVVQTSTAMLTFDAPLWIRRN